MCSEGNPSEGTRKGSRRRNAKVSWDWKEVSSGMS